MLPANVTVEENQAGAPTRGSAMFLTLSNARPLSVSALVLGLTSISSPFKDGTLGPRELPAAVLQ